MFEDLQKVYRRIREAWKFQELEDPETELLLKLVEDVGLQHERDSREEIWREILGLWQDAGMKSPGTWQGLLMRYRRAVGLA
ncbi:hypothetical protein ACFL3S_10360 [Gemmatimonadota bacterium]